jgi:hypothetical protein
MIAHEQLHRPSEASPQGAPIAVDQRRTVNDPGNPAEAANDRTGNRAASEFMYALGGGAVLLALALLLYALATWLGTGLAVYGEQFIGLFLAGALGTGVARQFAFNPR